MKRALRRSAPALALCGFGLVAGTASDRRAAPEPVRRAGYRVLEADFHAHSRLSDGLSSPFELVSAARRHGLDAIAVTEHNGVGAGKLAAWYARTVGGPSVVVGEEITTGRYHLIALGLQETVVPQPDLRAVLDEVHRQGGLAIAAHPVERFWPAFDPELAELDGAEVVHPIALRPAEGSNDGGWHWPEMVSFYERARAVRPSFAAIGSSDYHGFKVLGVVRTFVFADDDSPDAILAAIRAGRTVAEAPDGRRFGDAALIAAIEKEPLPPRDRAVGYQAAGTLDWLGRTAAWLGLVALVLVRLRRRSE